MRIYIEGNAIVIDGEGGGVPLDKGTKPRPWPPEAPRDAHLAWAKEQACYEILIGNRDLRGIYQIFGGNLGKHAAFDRARGGEMHPMIGVGLMHIREITSTPAALRDWILGFN